MKKSKKIILGIIIIILLFLIFIFLRLAQAPTQKNQAKMVGNDRDSHSCIASAGYTWCPEKNECLRSLEENCGSPKLDQAFIVLRDLRQSMNESSLDITYPQDDKMIWLLNSPKKILETHLNAKTISISKLDYKSMNNLENKIEEYFKKQGFTSDLTNQADGVDGGLVGFTKNNLVCLINHSHDTKEINPKQAYQIKVSCGNLK